MAESSAECDVECSDTVELESPGLKSDSCAVCKKAFSQPKMLPCLHAVCTSCLLPCVRSVSMSTFVTVCPYDGCGHEAKCPPLLQALPDHHLVKALTNRKPGKGQGKEHVCEECLQDSTDTATTWCEDCSLMLCHFHVTSHQRSRSTSSHRLVTDLSESTSDNGASSCAEESLTSCPFHPNEKINKFCKTCSHVICAQCAMSMHAGHSVVDTHAALDFLVEEFRQLEQSVESDSSASVRLAQSLARVKQNINDVNDKAERMSEEATAAHDDLIKLIEKQKASLLEKIDEARWKKLASLEKEEARLKHVLSFQQRALQMGRKSVVHLRDDKLLAMTSAVIPWLRNPEASLASGDGKSDFEAFQPTSWMARIESNNKTVVSLVEKNGLARFVDPDAYAKLEIECPDEVSTPFGITIIASKGEQSEQHNANARCVVTSPSGMKTECGLKKLLPNDTFTDGSGALGLECRTSSDVFYTTEYHVPLEKGVHTITVEHPDKHVGSSCVLSKAFLLSWFNWRSYNNQQILKMFCVGARVKPGPGWRGRDQGGGQNGEITSSSGKFDSLTANVTVRWDNGETHTYNMAKSSGHYSVCYNECLDLE